MKGVILLIRDGWGHRKEEAKNAIKEADTPVDDDLKSYPSTLLDASGEAVGLPSGYQGNSEVGHLTMGSGRVVDQELKRINDAISDESFYQKEELLFAIEEAKKNNSKLHILGLIQKEGVHSHMDHLFALLRLCKRENFSDVVIHAFTDGRDAPVNRGVVYINELVKKLEKLEVGSLKTITGRYFAMDRDERWDRTEKAYNCIMNGEGEAFKDPVSKINQCYRNDETDEFITPKVDEGYKGVSEGDSMIFFNFRTDRPRQLTKAITKNEFSHFERDKKEVNFVAMTDYYDGLNGKVVFKKRECVNLLGEVVSRAGLKQLRISETEKYAHVTFFFNGQEESPYKNESRIMIPSPDVAYYDKKPDMSVFKIAERLCSEVAKKEYNLIIANLVNCDMVGHTGNVEAIKEAVEAVDKATGTIVKTAKQNNYEVLILADHGNAEDQTDDWRTSHTTNPVPCRLVTDRDISLKGNRGLKDVAPTILNLLEVDKPEEMSGESMVDFKG